MFQKHLINNKYFNVFYQYKVRKKAQPMNIALFTTPVSRVKRVVGSVRMRHFYT